MISFLYPAWRRALIGDVMLHEFITGIIRTGIRWAPLFAGNISLSPDRWDHWRTAPSPVQWPLPSEDPDGAFRRGPPHEPPDLPPRPDALRLRDLVLSPDRPPRLDGGALSFRPWDSKRTKTNAPLGWSAHTLMGRKGFLPAQRSTRNWYRPYGLMWSYRAGDRCARSSGAICSPLDFSRSITAAM